MLQEWSIHQGMHYKNLGSKKTGLRWLVGVIRRLWQIAWNLWELRNEAEHLNDLKEANEKADEELELLITEGKETNDRWIKRMVQDQQLRSIRNGTLKIKCAWIRNYKSASTRAVRRINNSQDIAQMRRTMARFLVSG